MPDGLKITIQKTGERVSKSHTNADGQVDGNKPIATGIITVTTPDGEIHTFDFTSGGYGNGPLPGLNDPYNSSTYTMNLNVVVYNQDDYYLPMTGENGKGNYIEIIGDPSVVGERRGFALHPDGRFTCDWKDPATEPDSDEYNDGTAGCIGVDAHRSQEFFDLLAKHIPELSQKYWRKAESLAQDTIFQGLFYDPPEINITVLPSQYEPDLCAAQDAATQKTQENKALIRDNSFSLMQRQDASCTEPAQNNFLKSLGIWQQ